MLILAATLAASQAAAPTVQIAPTVRWKTDVNDLQIRNGTALDFGFEYFVLLPGGLDPEGDATLSVEICHNGDCTTSNLGAATHGTRFLRWGVDPSQYVIGDNLYRFTMRLDDNGRATADRMTFNIEVTP